MSMQVADLMKALPVLLQLNESAMLSETEIEFQPFKANERSAAEVHWLFRPEETGGCAAGLVRYAAGGSSPAHEHTGFEIIYIFDGEMITNQGVLRKNELICLPPGSQHSFHSETGCLALIIWEKPPQVVKP